MSAKTHLRRYMFGILGGSLGYAGAMIGVSLALKSTALPLSAQIALSLIPGLFVLYMLHTIWQFVRCVDEAQRYFFTQSFVVATFAVLAFSGVWGLIELLVDDVPHVPIFWIFPVFFVSLGLSSCFGPARHMGLK